LKTGSNDVFQIETSDGNEFLIPALKSVVSDINIAEKKIFVSGYENAD